MIRRIQARMRGRRTRCRVYKRMPRLAEIASRAEKARLAALADPSLWLCNRTNAALKTLLSSTVLGDVMRAVSSLEMFTLIAPYVCERMVAEGAVHVLLDSFARSNRSPPHLKVIGHGLRALLNIAKHEALRPSLHEHPDVVPALTDLWKSFCQLMYHFHV